MKGKNRKIKGLTKKEQIKLIDRIGGIEKVRKFLETGILDADITKKSIEQVKKAKAAHQEWCDKKGC